jgi:hypothetical protein
LTSAAGPVAAADDQTVQPTFVNTAERADWRQFRGAADHRGWNSLESTLSTANVSQLQILWRQSAGFNSSPAVARGVVYNGDGGLYALPADCRTDGDYCAPLWHGDTGYPDWASPAVGGGMVYMQSVNGLFAFTAGCRSDGGNCTPVWTGTNANAGYTSPTLAAGWLFAATGHGQLQAYDTARCAADGGACAPDWVADMMGESNASPAVSQGVVYAVTATGLLEAFPARCGVGGATCSPAWTGNLGSGAEASPAVADGVVYEATADGNAFAFKTNCATGGASCSPLWTRLLGGHTHASPAVTDTTVYFPVGRRIYAFAVACVKTGGQCHPLWRSGRAPIGGTYASSPAVANGVLYIATQGKYQSNGRLLAFNANCATDGSTCYAIWRSPYLGGMTNSSPAVAHGMVYLASNGGTFYAFGLPPAP